jgi:hypothetical protein
MDRSREFDPFVMDFPVPLTGDRGSDSARESTVIDSCFRDVFSDFPPGLVEAADPSSALAFYERTLCASRERWSLECVRERTQTLRGFFVREIRRRHNLFALFVDLGVGLSMHLNELKILLRRVSELNQAALYSVNKVFVRVLRKHLLFLDPSGYEERIPTSLAGFRQDFLILSDRLLPGVRDFIERRYPSAQSQARTDYIRLIETTFYIELVDSISVDELARLKEVDLMLAEIAANQAHIFNHLQEMATTAFAPAVLSAASRQLKNAMMCCAFSKMIDLALQTVALLAAALPENLDNRKETITAGLAWCALDGSGAVRLQYLALWCFFVRCIFPERCHFADLISGRNMRGWDFFESLFQRI